MELLTIIGVNFAVALVLFIGAVVGYKKGYKQSLVALLATSAILVGVTLITPLITTELLKISYVQQHITPDLVVYFKTLVFALISFVFVTIELLTVGGIFKKRIIKKLLKKSEESKKFIRKSTAKVVKTRKQLRQERKSKERDAYRTRDRNKGASKFFGLIFGLVIAAALVIVGYLPFRERNKVQPSVGFETNIVEIIDNGTLDKIVELF